MREVEQGGLEEGRGREAWKGKGGGGVQNMDGEDPVEGYSTSNGSMQTECVSGRGAKSTMDA